MSIQRGQPPYRSPPALRPSVRGLAGAGHAPQDAVRPPDVDAFLPAEPLQRDAAAPLVRRTGAFPIVRGGLVMPGALFVSAMGEQLAISNRGEDGRTFLAAARGQGAFSGALALPVQAAGVAGVTVGGRDYLYSVEPGLEGQRLVRRELRGATLGPPEAVLIRPQPQVMHWPQLTALPDGRVVFAAISPGQPYLAVSADGGRSFELSAALGHTASDWMTLAHVGGFADGTLVVTTQVADAQGQVQAFVRTSADGRRFSAPVPVCSSNPNVHDAYPVSRGDGAVDLYYLRQAGQGFEAYRRSFTRDGRLGPEQRLTGPELGSVEKPQARRLPDGSVRLVFARRERPDAFEVMSAVLPGEAPLPG